MDIRPTSIDFSLPLSGSGPRTAPQTLVFPRPVKQAVAGIAGYLVEYSGGDGNDHHVGQIQVKLDTVINANTVTVNGTFGLRDWSGDWDDEYDGSIQCVVLADLVDPSDIPPRNDMIITGMEVNQAVQFFRTATYLDATNAQPDNPPVDHNQVGIIKFQWAHGHARPPERFAGAYPNMHSIQVHPCWRSGCILLWNGPAEWRDIPWDWLGRPPLNDFVARMTATNDYAARNGYTSGFPTFHHADYGAGIVCGTVLLHRDHSVWIDLPFSEIGNPPVEDIGARFRGVNDWAAARGYVSGYPNMHHIRRPDGRLVGGAILIPRSAGEWRDVTHSCVRSNVPK
jgi:hypothetical protein